MKSDRIIRRRLCLFQSAVVAWLLGAGVFAATIYRVFVLQLPEAELMGVFGVGALVVNVLCAVILLKHRTGDANVQAVWLFSRNDALGNVAILIAAALVWFTATPWPDLIVAALIAGLFLHGAWTIIVRANHELADTGETSN